MDCYVAHSYHRGLSILCRVPEQDAEHSGNVDLRIGVAQLVC